MYTQKQFDGAYARFSHADDAALRCIKNAFHMRTNLSDEAQAKLAAALKLQNERKVNRRRELQRARYAASKI